MDDSFLTTPYGALPNEDWRGLEWRSLERSVRVGHVKVRYVDVGSAEGSGTFATLLLHGMGSSYKTWLSTIPALTKTGRVIAPDLPGFGMSTNLKGVPDAQAMATFLNDFCYRIGVGRVNVVGHSLGGLLALQLARSFPGRVGRLVLVSACLKTVVDALHHPLRTLTRAPRICLSFGYQLLCAATPIPNSLLRFVMSHQELRAVACISYVRYPRLINPELMREAFESTGRSGSVLSVIGATTFHLDDVVSAVATGRHEVLVIAGDRDTLVPRGDTESLVKRLHGARLIRLVDTGHWPTLERPIALNSILRAWLGGSTP